MGFRNYGPYVRTEAAYRRVTAEYGIETVVMECTHSAQAGQRSSSRTHPRPPRYDGGAGAVRIRGPGPGVRAEPELVPCVLEIGGSTAPPGQRPAWS
jgi:hypothetical protein